MASFEVLPDGSKGGWIEEMFSVQQRWNPTFFWVEAGVIWESVRRLVDEEMRLRDIWINIVEIPSIKDKATRGRTLQKRHRAGGMRFDKGQEWYPGYEQELLRFTGLAAARLDDQFDSTANVCLGFQSFMMETEPEDFMEDEEVEILGMNRMRRQANDPGRSRVTGY